MGMSMKHSFAFLAIPALAFCLASCMHESFREHGSEIRFGAQSSSSSITKTVYSYHQETVSSKLMERIDWVNGDMIRILSDQVTNTPKYFDYDLTLSENVAVKSFATAAPHGADHGLQWGSGTHTFFSLYPSPSTTSAGIQSGISISLTGGSSATATAILPADQSSSAQTVTLDDNSTAVYYGNMNLAYMTAAAQVAEGSDVTLSFKPMVTTFFVSVANTTGAPLTLRKVELKSSSSALSGRFMVNMDKDNNRPGDYEYWDGDSWESAPVRTETNASIYATFSGQVIPVAESITVALFALPHEINNLTLTVTADETGPVSLALKENDAFLSFAGEKKHNINNISVPSVSYYLDVDKTGISYDYTGAYTSSAQDFTVTSYKTIGGSVRDVPWETQIWIDADNDGVQDSDEWTALADVTGTANYSWLSGFPTSSSSPYLDPDPDGSTTTHTFEKSVGAQDVVSHEERLRNGVIYGTDGVTPVTHDSPATAVDLSYYDFVNRKMETSCYTANTYIVSAPGYYKIPLVFGNAIENGQTVPDSYNGRTGTGHLNYFICPLPGGSESSIHLVSTRPWLNADRSRGARIHWEKYSYWDDNSSSMLTQYGTWSSPNPTTVVDNLSITTGSGNQRYMVFHVDETNIRPGNLILAAMSNADGTGNVCWSWQIWITDQDMTPISINNKTSDYAILPVNLGWIDDSKGQHFDSREVTLRFASTEKTGLYSSNTLTVSQLEKELISTSGWSTYYQWGRKDPMTDGPTQTYDNDGYVHESIKHPGNIMYDKGSYWGERYYDWTVNNYNNLWESKNTSWKTPSGDLPNHKTVYDPSPRRYCVPPDNTWDRFADGYVSASSAGIFFPTGVGDNTVFFPAAGFMNYINASSSTGDDIMNGYWTYHPGENVQRRASYCMRFTYNNSSSAATVVTKNYDEMDRAYGFSVRPVASFMVGMQYAVLNFADAGWADGQQITDQSYTVDGVTVTISKRAGLGDNPTYSSSAQSAIVNRYCNITITSAVGNISDITLEFGEGDGGDNLGSSNISISSPGGTYSNGYWYANYNSETGVLNPAATTVVLQTAATGNARIIKSITVAHQ